MNAVAPLAVNKVLLQSSMEASVNINQRELSELSGANESIMDEVDGDVAICPIPQRRSKELQCVQLLPSVSPHTGFGGPKAGLNPAPMLYCNVTIMWHNVA